MNSWSEFVKAVAVGVLIAATIVATWLLVKSFEDLRETEQETANAHAVRVWRQGGAI